MATGELSGHINGLIIMSSAALALAQYVHSTEKQRFNDAQEEVRRNSPVVNLPNANDPRLEEVRRRYDILSEQKIPTLGLQIIYLFGILCASGVIKGADSISVLFFDNQWSNVLLFFIGSLSLILSLLVIAAGWNLARLHSVVSNFERDAQNFAMQLRMARGFQGTGSHPLRQG
jgi:hypothetical protein